MLQVLKVQRSMPLQLPSPEATLRTVTEQVHTVDCSQESTQGTEDAQRAADAAGVRTQRAQLGISRRSSSWVRRKQAQMCDRQESLRQGEGGTRCGTAQATPPTLDTPGRPCEPGDSRDGAVYAAADAAHEATPDGAASGGQHCHGANGDGFGHSDTQPDVLDSGIPGWVDYFGKDPPPGWTCSPLEDWDFGSEGGYEPALFGSDGRPDEQQLPQQARREDTAAAPHLQSNGCPAAPNDTQQDSNGPRRSARQVEAGRCSAAVKPPAMRKPRGWRPPVDMFIPRVASLYCSGHRRRYGLPAARESCHCLRGLVFSQCCLIGLLKDTSYTACDSGQFEGSVGSSGLRD